jgi:hypothetical protein
VEYGKNLSVPTKKKVVHGDDLLYRFFQDVLPRDPELFARVPELLLGTMSIWLPLDIYREWPVLLPWVVRDPTCRGSKAKGIPDQWSAPDATGYLRDDNSLIKSLPRALSVRGPVGSHMSGARMGTEFVAAHVWRKVHHAKLASRVPLLNSFVPNLVWLPGQIAKLTDVEGGVVQRTLQAMSHAIYRDYPVADHLKEVVAEAWALIPEPEINVKSVELVQLNWFESTPRFFAMRSARLREVAAALDLLDVGQALPNKVVSRRYTQGLPTIDLKYRQSLRAHLRRFERVDAVS